MSWRWKSWLCFTLTNNSKFPSQFLGVDSLLHIARWAASPVFAILLPARTTDQPNGGWSLTNPMWWKKSEDIWCRKSAVSQRNERNDANIHTCEDWISVGDIPGCLEEQALAGTFFKSGASTSTFWSCQCVPYDYGFWFDSRLTAASAVNFMWHVRIVIWWFLLWLLVWLLR